MTPKQQPKLEPGNVVMIYEDPLTCLRPEGKARLCKKHIIRDSNGTEYWEVEFEDDGFVCLRWVSIK